MSLLNLLCNATNPATSQANLVRRDGCYGCFFRAISYNKLRQTLIELNNCTRQYLNITGTPPGSNFMTCVTNFNNYVSQLVVSEPTPGTCPQSQNVLCQFVNCIREQNANALIEQCYLEVGFVNMDVIGRRNFYINMTRCILGKVRCGRYNPISGELQSEIHSQLSVTSVQITTTGTIRMFKIPISLLYSPPHSHGNFCQQNTVPGYDLQASYPIADGIC